MTVTARETMTLVSAPARHAAGARRRARRHAASWAARRAFTALRHSAAPPRRTIVKTATKRHALLTAASRAVAQRKERAVPGPPDRPAERPDARARPDTPARPDAPRAPDGRAPWARDDLRERLRQLPPGLTRPHSGSARRPSLTGR
jgi:hypothetical protein